MQNLDVLVPPKRDGNDLPMWRMNNLPHHYLTIIQHAYDTCFYKRCSVCNISAKKKYLKTCKGCGHIRVNPVYYCSRKCQRRDWDNHRSICDKDHQGPYEFVVPEACKSLRTARIEARRLWRRLESLRPVIEWAAKQFHYSSNIQDPWNACVEFMFNSVYENGYPRFELNMMHISERNQEPPSTSPGDMMRGQYRAIICQHYEISGWVSMPVLEHPKKKDIDYPIAQWPWILCDVTWRLHTDKAVHLMTLQLLVDAVKEYHQRNLCGRAFEPFVVDCFDHYSYLNGMSDWSRLMGNVVIYDPDL